MSPPASKGTRVGAKTRYLRSESAKRFELKREGPSDDRPLFLQVMHFVKGTHYHTPHNEKATNADVPTLGGAVVVHSVTGKLLSSSQKKIAQANTGLEWGTITGDPVDIDFIRVKISAWSFLGRQGKYPHSFTQEFYSALRTSAYRDEGKNVFKGGLRLPRIGSA